MMRAFLAKRNVKGKIKARQESLRQKSQDSFSYEPSGEEPAAVTGNDFIEDDNHGDDNETAIVNDDYTEEPAGNDEGNENNDVDEENEIEEEEEEE